MRKKICGKMGKMQKIKNATSFQTSDFCAYFSEHPLWRFDKAPFLWYYMVTIFQQTNYPN